MSTAVGVTVRIGLDAISTETHGHFGLTRQARARGMASIYRRHDLLDPSLYGEEWGQTQYEEYGRIKLADVRTALDNLTIEDSEEEVVKIFPGNDDVSDARYWTDKGRGYATELCFTLTPEGKVAVRMPCGEKRTYKVRTLDKALTRLGA